MKFHDGDKTLEEKGINGKLTGLVERKRSPSTSRRNNQSAGNPEALRDVPVIVRQAAQPTSIAELPCSSFLPLSLASRASLLSQAIEGVEEIWIRLLRSSDRFDSWEILSMNGNNLKVHRVESSPPGGRSGVLHWGRKCTAESWFPRGGPKLFGLDKWEWRAFLPPSFGAFSSRWDPAGGGPWSTLWTKFSWACIKWAVTAGGEY
ncbi:hypothetical protein U1Q18_031292 [Sarracenia purpurea var. burkii]